MAFRILLRFSYLVLVIVAIQMIGFTTKYVLSGGKALGPMTGPFITFIDFPWTVIGVARELGKNEKIVYVDPDIKPINQLDYDLHALNGHFDRYQWTIQLKNLRTGEVAHQWHSTAEHFKEGEHVFANSEPRQPILLPDRSLVLHHELSPNLLRLDANSQIVWQNHDFVFHHAINPAADGHIWACTKSLKKAMPSPRGTAIYHDNGIAKIDVHTGKTLFHASISEVLEANGYSHLIHAFANFPHPGGDPLHLNDIEPVTADGPFWLQGDLFLSLRHRSLVMHYRPATGKIIRMIWGDFLMQHDVDIVSDSAISIFDNHISVHLDPAIRAAPSQDSSRFGTAKIIEYHLGDSSSTLLHDGALQRENAYTETEGLHERLSNGDMFVECQNDGLIYLFRGDLTIYRGYAHEPNQQKVECPHWIRLYEDIDF